MKKRCIGVITPTSRLFEMWKRHNDLDKVFEDRFYIPISRDQDLRGRQFDEIINGYLSYEVSLYVRLFANKRINKEQTI